LWRGIFRSSGTLLYVGLLSTVPDNGLEEIGAR
jgi:hypothetical protein